MSFDAVNSVRARVDLKAYHKTSDVVRGYVVAAFENEFDFELPSSINGKAIEYVDLKGRSLTAVSAKAMAVHYHLNMINF